MTEVEVSEQPGTGAVASFPAIPVRTEGQDLSGGHQGVHLSFQLNAENPVIQLLPRDYDRLEARVTAYATSSTPNSGSTLTVTSHGTPTTAFQQIGSDILTDPPAGQYSVTVVTYLDGTIVAADDEDNFRLSVSSGGSAINLLQPAVADQVMNSGPFIITVNGSQNIAVQTGATAPSGTAVYHATLIATPISGSIAAPSGIVLAQAKEIAEFAANQGTGFAGPAGSFLPIGDDRTLRNCDEVWAASLSSTPVLVSAIVSRRLAVANPAI
jgi:hypothetical protein